MSLINLIQHYFLGLVLTGLSLLFHGNYIPVIWGLVMVELTQADTFGKTLKEKLFWFTKSDTWLDLAADAAGLLTLWWII